MKDAFGLVQRGIYIFRVENGKLTSAVGVEDNLSRMRQLGMQLIRNPVLTSRGAGGGRPQDALYRALEPS